MDTSPASPAAETTRECAVCKQAKPLTSAFWKTTGRRDGGIGNPGGTTCKTCLNRATGERRKQLRAELRAKEHPALRALPTAKQAERSTAAAKKRAEILEARLALATPKSGLDMSLISPTKLSTAVALKHGADVIVREAPRVLELLSMYASDPESPHHEWALQLFADRILPQRAFAALAIKEAGLEEKGGATPRVTINVVTSRGPQAQDDGRVIEVEPQPSEGSDE